MGDLIDLPYLDKLSHIVELRNFRHFEDIVQIALGDRSSVQEVRILPVIGVHFPSEHELGALNGDEVLRVIDGQLDRDS